MASFDVDAQTTPLLSQNANMSSYSSIDRVQVSNPKPKLTVVIPPNRRPRPVLLTGATRDVLVDIDQLRNLSDASSCGYHTAASEDRVSNHCEFCTLHNLQHDPRVQASDISDYDIQGERVLALLEVFISVQKYLLIVLIPALVLFVMTVHVLTR